MSAHAKLGDNIEQLIKRFGKSYKTERISYGTKYEFESKEVSVDVVVADGVSVAETYYSDHPLTAAGEPPNDIVQAILRTNVPGAHWDEISGGDLAQKYPGMFAKAAPLGSDYTLRSSDSKYVATLKYTRPLPAGVIWTMTVVAAGDVLVAAASESSGPPVAARSSTPTAISPPPMFQTTPRPTIPPPDAAVDAARRRRCEDAIANATKRLEQSPNDAEVLEERGYN